MLMRTDQVTFCSGGRTKLKCARSGLPVFYQLFNGINRFSDERNPTLDDSDYTHRSFDIVDY